MSKCIYDECNKIPVFNFPLEIKGMYCSNHKLEHMIDVKHRKCLHKDCIKRPSFNFPSEIK